MFFNFFKKNKNETDENDFDIDILTKEMMWIRHEEQRKKRIEEKNRVYNSMQERNKILSQILDEIKKASKK